MNSKHKLGAASVLAAAWYSGAAAATGYSTQIYSVAVDAQTGTVRIDGVDLAPAGSPGSAHVQLLGQTLAIREATSSNTHLDAALPESLSLYPGTGYQLYVSPDRSLGSSAATPADQALFTVYVSSRVDGAKATTVVTGGGHGATDGSVAGGTKSVFSTNNLFSSLGSAFSLNSHSTTNTASGVTTSNGSTFTLPYSGSASSATPLFSLTNTSSGDAIDGINSSSAANAVAIRGLISSTATGAGSAAVLGSNNATGNAGYGVWGTQNGSGIGVYGLTHSSGLGVRGRNTATGTGVYADNSSSGKGLYATSYTGVAGTFVVTNTGSKADVLDVANAGTGLSLSVSNTNTSNAADTVAIATAGTGAGETITNSNSSSTANTFSVTSNSDGDIPDPTQGNAGNFFKNNPTGVGAGVRGEVNSTYGNFGTAGVYGVGSGAGGYGGFFEQTSANGFGTALYATTAGFGIVAQFVTGPTNNANATVSITQNGTGDALYATTNGYGSVAQFVTSATGNSSTAVSIQHNGIGEVLDLSNTNGSTTANVLNVTAAGGGNAGGFAVSNNGSAGAAVVGQTNSTFGLGHGVPPSTGVYGLTTGTDSYGGYFEHNNSNGFGGALYATSAGQGSAGEFYTTSTSNGTPTVFANQQGNAPVLQMNKASAGGDLVILENGGSNVIRFDSSGRGYFDGGTQNSGADLAEFVPTTGATPQVGDVVEIDPAHPDSFRLCSKANTTRVAGIISTAPGVTLNARDGAKQDVTGPALALAGRVPTKVNNRGGKIRIGDLLVASAEPGRAMRAPAHPRPGTVIGKALQDSDAAEGSVEVLVMLR